MSDDRPIQPRSPLCSRNAMPPPTTPRTPRRTCKDEALTKILYYFEHLHASSPPKSKIPATPKTIPRRREGLVASRQLRTPTRHPLRASNDINSADDVTTVPDATSSSSDSDPSFDDEDDDDEEEEDSSEFSASSSSTDSSVDAWTQRKKSRHSRKRASTFKSTPQPDPTLQVITSRSTSAVLHETCPNPCPSRFRLHASRLTDSLPCREREFDAIFEFLFERLQNRTGGCMYISGVPGTGKTATVTAVVESMAGCVDASGHSVIPPFTFIAVNGMQVSEPRHVYVRIYEELKGARVSVAKAMAQLEHEFCAPCRTQTGEPTCVLLIDELDLLCSRRQDVLYSLFDWPCRQTGQRCRRPLVVLAIANTMDLPERLLHHRVASRLGLNRLPFAPYSHEQLAEIVTSRLGTEMSSTFAPKAIELAGRKVAAVSGDARRALDVCRRAAELSRQEGAKTPTTIHHVNAALKEMFTSPKLTALRSASHYEKLLLRAIVSEASARSAEEVRLDRCMEQMYALCNLEGLPRPTDTEVFSMCAALGAYKLILVEASRRDTNMLVRLNCSQSDVLFALKASSSS
ncbi:unnamed protein product [Mesocestoides corti]|uniref:Origin recognition complex subunit 1 n=2 Tax=Mesocestoides corti TaxID=53468 RepID=A0A0R3U6R8_MESCO|nr:unnamed protein product [Mesocestoides corti]